MKHFHSCTKIDILTAVQRHAFGLPMPRSLYTLARRWRRYSNVEPHQGTWFYLTRYGVHSWKRRSAVFKVVYVGMHATYGCQRRRTEILERLLREMQHGV